MNAVMIDHFNDLSCHTLHGIYKNALTKAANQLMVWQ